MKSKFVMLSTFVDGGVAEDGTPNPRKRFPLFLNLNELKILSIVHADEGNILTFSNGFEVKNILIEEDGHFFMGLME